MNRQSIPTAVSQALGEHLLSAEPGTLKTKDMQEAVVAARLAIEKERLTYRFRLQTGCRVSQTRMLRDSLRKTMDELDKLEGDTK